MPKAAALAQVALFAAAGLWAILFATLVMPSPVAPNLSGGHVAAYRSWFGGKHTVYLTEAGRRAMQGADVLFAGAAAALVALQLGERRGGS